MRALRIMNKSILTQGGEHFYEQYHWRALRQGRLTLRGLRKAGRVREASEVSVIEAVIQAVIERNKALSPPPEYGIIVGE